MTTKDVCKKYGLKSGPFSKVKKAVNVWATNIYKQSLNGPLPQQVPQQEQKIDYQPPKSNPPPNHSKFVTEVTYESTAHHEEMAGKKWYWFNEEAGYKWIPYRDEDSHLLSTTWQKGSDFAVIVSGRYRVDFKRNEGLIGS